MIGVNIPMDGHFNTDPLGWLAQQAGETDMNTLLLHCAEGVTWGRRVGGTFELSPQAFPRALDALTIRADTLIQARLFGPAGEIFVWRAGPGFAARKIVDAEQPLTALDADEVYWLWGTRQEAIAGFTLLNEGQQGFRHAPPLADVPANRRVGLRVRHYTEEDEDGWQRIVTSRLVDLQIVKEG